MATETPTSTPEKSQFSLRALLICIAGVAVTLGVSRWNIFVGVTLGMALLGILIIVFGARRRRRGRIVVGSFVVVGALAVFAIPSISVVMWVGSRKLDVYVLVVEASTLQPIANATIEPMNGPDSPLEISPRVHRDFHSIPRPVPIVTDDRGQASFSHRFHAAGSDGLFVESGYVETARVWLRVTAPGYVTTYLPIDQQSPRPRDIKNDTPIYVTVPVAKQ